MRNIVPILLFFVGAMFGQEDPNYAKVAKAFMQDYNAGDYHKIFDRFDDAMQKAMPKDQCQLFFEQQLKRPMGQLLSMNYNKRQNGAHVYSSKFEKAATQVLLSLDAANHINGLYIMPPAAQNPAPQLERNTTKMILPFKEEWFVFWGGTTIKENYHVAEVTQKYAYDLLMVKYGKSYKGDPTKNESYFAFGKEIIAPCDATVVMAIDGVYDNIPGELNPNQVTGNTVVLETAANEYLLFAHLKEASVTVSKGQKAKQGQKIGECGNSGNSTEPHLHLSLQNHPKMEKSTGAKLYFSQILVNGKLETEHLPVKESFVKNSTTK